MSRSRMLLLAAVVVAGVTLAARSFPARPVEPGAGSATDTAFVSVGSGENAEGAFVAWPAGKRAVPAVVVVQEWWGLNGQIRDVARRLAQQGYAAIVPDLYHGKVADDPMTAHELVRGLVDTEALGTLKDAVAWLRAQPRTARAKIGAIGFCMGGGLSEQMALQGTGVACAVMFYGAPETDPAKLAPLAVPLQAHFGEQDQGIPVKRVEEFKAALGKAGKSAEVYVYPGAGHAFMHDGAESYRPDAARQAWARTLAFFQKHLKA